MQPKKFLFLISLLFAITAIACSQVSAQGVERALPRERGNAGISETANGESGKTRPGWHSGVELDDGRVDDFTVESYSHGTFRLSDFAGQPVVINFWFPSCPGCRIEKPFLRAADAQWSPEGVVFLGAQLVGVDSVEDGKTFLEENGLGYRNFADRGAFARQFEIFGYPSTVFLDTDHRVHTKKTGAIQSQSDIDIVLRQIQQKGSEIDNGGS